MPVKPRRTRQKEAIRSAIETAARPLGPEEILVLAKAAVDGLSIATVYRNISLMVEEGWLTPVALPGDIPRYELAGKEHHHHFHCTGCDKVFEVPGCQFQTPKHLPAGFRTTGHDLLLHGLCSMCA